MAKLLSESTVRRFQKLANVKVLREQEEPVEMPEDEMELPEDPMAGAEMAEDEIPEAAREELAQELVEKIGEVLGVDIDVAVEETEGANDLPDEPAPDALPPGDEGMEGEGEDEELAALQEWLLKEGYGLDEEDDYMMEELYEEGDYMMDDDPDMMEGLYEEDDYDMMEGDYDLMEELYEEDDMEDVDLDMMGDDLDDAEMMMESKIRKLKKQLAERKRLNKRASVITERVWKRLKRGR